MKYASTTQQIQAPQALQLNVKGRAYDIVLHLGERMKSAAQVVGRGGRRYDKEQRYPSYFLWLYTGGNGTFALGGRIHRFRRGTLVLSDPVVPHTVFVERSPEASVFYLGFAMVGKGHDPFMLPFHELLSIWSGERLSPIEFPTQLKPQGARVLDLLLDNYAVAMAPKGMFHYFPAHKAVIDILSFLVEQVYSKAEPSGSGDPALLRTRLEIEAHYDEKLTLRGLAENVFISPEHLCRAFRAVFGCSPIAYQKELRLREAKALLHSSNMGIGEIAQAVGFRSVYHFSRIFSTHIGCAPSLYRARIRGVSR